MKQVLAAVVAIALVVGAYVLRTEVIAPDSGSDTTVQTADPPDAEAVADARVICDARLGSACPSTARRMDAVDMLTAFTDPDPDVDVVIAPSIVLEMIAATRENRATFDADPTVLATTPMVVAIAANRSTNLDDPCGATIAWSCVSDLVVTGQIRPGLTDPADDSDGIVALAALAGGYFAGGNGSFSLNGFSDGGFIGWLGGVQLEAIETNSAVTDIVRFGGSQNDTAIVTEAVALAAIERAAGNAPVLRYPSPLASLAIVASGVNGADVGDVDDIRLALLADNWRNPDGSPITDGSPSIPADDDGLPDGGVLVALQERW